jgi:hypothetical protein
MAEVKTRLIMNLTKRQVVCFGAAAAIGAPLFLAFKDVLGNTGAMTIMIAAVIPAFFFAIYNKDGVIPAEKFLLLILRQMFFYPKIRVFRTQNIYSYIENNASNMKEGYFEKSTQKHAGAAKTSAERKTAKGKGSPKGKNPRT